MHCADEKMTLVVYGLDPTINSFVSRQREKHARMSFLKLVQLAQTEGDAVRARVKNRRTTGLADPPVSGNPEAQASPGQKTGSVLFMAPDLDVEESSSTPNGPSRHALIHYMEYAYDSEREKSSRPQGSSKFSDQLLSLEGGGAFYRSAMVPPHGVFKGG